MRPAGKPPRARQPAPGRGALAALVLSLVLAGASCSGSETNPRAAATARAATEAGPVDVLRIGWSAEPSLDPALAADATSASLVLNLMDPLVRLGDDLQPVPSLAKRWDVSADGRTVTFHLRQDALWTNGDPVTAHDFEYAWKRVLDPELASVWAVQLYGIEGARDYHTCERGCSALRDGVAITAAGDHTLEVELTSPQPWFVQRVAHHAFLAVHERTVEAFGEAWTEPETIVTNGPFQLAEWEHGAKIVLVKDPDWRVAGAVTVDRVQGLILDDPADRLEALRSGEVDALQGLDLGSAEIEALPETHGYVVYPALETTFVGFNVRSVPDANQRRALALAIDRRAIVDRLAAGLQPATSFTARGVPGFELISPGFLPAEADLESAAELMALAAEPKTELALWAAGDSASQAIAAALREAWHELGVETTLETRPFEELSQLLGPPPDATVDVYLLGGQSAEYPDAFTFLERWTCAAPGNTSGFCNPEYDRLVEEARRTADAEARYELYGRLEAMLTGPAGAMPVAPVYWHAYGNLENDSVRDTFAITPVGVIDFTRVVIKKS